MRYRRLDANGDMTFGQGQGNFWINQPEAVAQSVLTRLRLHRGEWFYDTSDGTPWNTEVLGERTQSTRDLVVRERVNLTPGVQEMDTYGSVIDVNTRVWTAAMTLTTDYGPVALAVARLPASIPELPQQAPSGDLVTARALGVAGGTALAMVPANLAQGPRADIRDFEIQTMQAGSW